MNIDKLIRWLIMFMTLIGFSSLMNIDKLILDEVNIPLKAVLAL